MPPSLFDEPARSAPSTVTRSGSLGELQQLEDRIALQGEGTQAELCDPVIWQASVVVPAFSGQGRLVLREFERYDSDRTVPDKLGSVTCRKRVAEERLVFSEFFPLN